MAPDVNSLPESPRQDRAQPAQSPHPTSASTSRRASHQMPPPPVPGPGFAHSHSHRSPTLSGSEHPGVPLRHPRPLTAAELFDQCEKENEAVVNRLTRELTALRAQSASVASNASQSSNSTSASLLPIDIGDSNPNHQLTGATHPTPSRQRRSSSSLSARSIPHTPSTSTSVAGSSITGISTQAHAGSVIGGHGTSQASADRAAATGYQRSLSRQPSVTASGSSTPARSSLDIARAPGSYTLPHRPSLSRDPSYMSQTTNASSTAAHAGTPVATSIQAFPSPAQSSPSQSVGTPHFSDTAAYRSEMDIVKAENEALRQQVRALQRALQARRRDSSNSETARSDISAARAAGRGLEGSAIVTSPEPTMRAAASPGVGVSAATWTGNDGGVGGVAGPRERSESQSTTASSRRGAQAEDDVRLGESAGSVGIGRGA